MKNKLCKLISAFFCTALLALSACGNNRGKDTTTSSADTGEDLELLYFGKPKEDNANQEMLMSKPMLKPSIYQCADELDEGEPTSTYEYEVDYGDQVVLEVYIKNIKRLSFMDIVVYSASTNKKYVFTDGNGEYNVQVSTVLENDVWTTKLRFHRIGWSIIEKDTNSCTFDTYLEIEEINFLNLEGNVTSTNVAENDIKTVNIHATDYVDSRSHTWTEWEYFDPTCDQWRRRYHRCEVCGKDHFENIYEYSYSYDPVTDGPLGHIYEGEWEIINKTPKVLQGNDLFQSKDICSRCHEIISMKLCSIANLNDASYDLVIPSDIERIETHTFTYCKFFKTVRIPKSVQFIGNGAFYECINLTDAYFESSVPPEMEGVVEGLFDPVWREDSNPFKIHVPVNALEAYQKIHDNYWPYFGVPRLVADIPVA